MCERAQDGYAYNPNRDYHQTYAEAYVEGSTQSFEESNVGEEQVQDFFSVMMRVLDGPVESVLAAR